MYNSVSIALFTTAAVLVIGTLGSFALARITFRGSRTIQSLTLFTYIIPSSFLSIPFFKLMADYDLIGSKLSVILVMITFASPYAVWILWDYGKTIPPGSRRGGGDRQEPVPWPSSSGFATADPAPWWPSAYAFCTPGTSTRVLFYRKTHITIPTWPWGTFIIPTTPGTPE
jgi:hypothetical protein